MDQTSWARLLETKSRPSPSPRLRRVPDLLQVLHTPSRQTQPTVGRPLWAGRIGMKRTFGCHGGLVVDVCLCLLSSVEPGAGGCWKRVALAAILLAMGGL